tara:strand:- start:48 stop:590 length:543 start_codon:yes stop_codon:yes gene_type:complete
MIHKFIERYKVDHKVCDGLIDYFKKNKEYKNQGEVGDGVVNKKIKNSKDVSFMNGSNDTRIENFFKALNPLIANYAQKYGISDAMRTASINNIQHYEPKGGYPVFHYENSFKTPYRTVVYMLYLNTVTDGGGTHFPFQDTLTNAIKGDMILWPAGFTHPHRGIVSETQEKYICTGWFEIV